MTPAASAPGHHGSKDWAPLVGAAALALAATFGALACSGNGGNGGAGGGPGSGTGNKAVDALCAGVIQDNCAMWLSCTAMRYADADHCAASLECLGAMDLVAQVESGWVTLDETAAENCHARLQAEPCDGDVGSEMTVEDFLAYCPEAATGAQAAGELCRLDADCVAGTYCLGTPTSCGGTCTALGQAAETCGRARCDTEAGFYCGPDSTCTPNLQAGDPCDPSRGCGSETWCDLGTDTCRAFAAEGESCEDTNGSRIACEPGTWCDDVSTTTPTCEVWTGGDGDPCRRSSDCRGLFVCVDNACVIEGREGYACTEHGDCDPANFYCPSGTCTQMPGDGEPCADRGTLWGPGCRLGFYCDEGTCVADSYPGDACASDDQCAESWCQDNGKCGSPGDLGASCEADVECRSYDCDGGVCRDGWSCLAEG